MRKLLLLIVVALIGSLPIFAQSKAKGKNHHEMRKELREFKIKFLAQEMELTEEQQKQFVPLYDQMSQEKHAIFKETRDLEEKVSSNKNATEADYDALSKKMLEAKQKDAFIEKNYDEKFSKFLSAKQIVKMKTAEDKFRRKMHDMRKSGEGKSKNRKPKK